MGQCGRRFTSRRARKVWRTARATVPTSDRSTRPSHRSTDCCATLPTLSLLRFAVPKSTSDATSFRFGRGLPDTIAVFWPGSTQATRTAACPTLERRSGRVSSASSSWRHGVRGSPAPTTTKPARWVCEIWSCRTLNIELEYGRTELRHGRLRHDLLCRPEPQLHLPHDQGSGAQCEPASCLVLVYL